MSERSDHAKTGTLDARPNQTVRPGHHPSWTDGFPQTFHGWGPQTPDIDSDAAPQINFGTPEGDLHWRGRDNHEGHIVWRFDSRIH